MTLETTEEQIEMKICQPVHFPECQHTKLIPSPHHKRNKTLERLKTDAHGSKMWPLRHGQLGQLRRQINLRFHCLAHFHNIKFYA